MAAKRAPKGAATALGVSALVVDPFVPQRSLVMLLVHEREPDRVEDAILSGRVTGSGLRAIRTELRLNVDEMARLLDVASRTINRKEKAEQALSVSEGDRAFRLARTADLAVQLIGDREKALSWLRTPNTYLRGKTPLEMLDTEIGNDFVIESLYSIAYGGVA